MKHSKLRCIYGFHCCRYNTQHCWLAQLLIIIALTIAQVSPKITTITTTTTTTAAATAQNDSSNDLESTSLIVVNNKPNAYPRTTLTTQQQQQQQQQQQHNVANNMTASMHTQFATLALQMSSDAAAQQQQQQQQATEWPTTTTTTTAATVTIATASPPTTTTTAISTTLSTSFATYNEYTTAPTTTTTTTTTTTSIAKYAKNVKVRRTRQLDDIELAEKCRRFVVGDEMKNELYSPDYPNDYPRNISCTRVIKAPKGQVIRIDFRNSFHIEEKEECKFDFLEIRDGQYGYSEIIGRYCGTDFPPEITTRERYLWLHFQSDESIEYSGFTAVYKFLERSRDSPSTDINCTIEKDGYEGFINSTDVPPEIMEIVETDKIPLDCLWHIEVPKNWKIQLKFLDFKLSKPNDCDSNFLDIFPEETVMPARLKNFCGSAGEGVISESNVLHIHFFAEQEAIASTFGILFTAFRDRGTGVCNKPLEFDCDDSTCIHGNLSCNGRDNCKFRGDEESCGPKKEGQSEHVVIIIIVFGLILGGMMITFLVNCMRKLIHDQRIIREHIRQSKESKLDAMGRQSKAQSKENIPLDVSLRQKQMQTSLEILADLPEHYYPEVVPLPPSHASKDAKEKEHSILRHHQQHDMNVQTSICDDSSTTTTADGDNHDYGKEAPRNACEMGCQTRESLFVTTPILSKPPIGTVGFVPPPRLSTFAIEPNIKTIPETPESIQTPHYYTHLPEHQHSAMPHGDLPPPSRLYHEPMCHLHHHAHPMMRQPHAQHAYDERQPQHHHHYHTQRQQPQHQALPPAPAPAPPPPIASTSSSAMSQQPLSKPQMKSEITLPISVPYSAPIVEAAPQPPVATNRPKLKPRGDQPREYMDVRNSAPDVIIMTSH